MFILFEDDGEFKAGVLLADNETSLQLETTTGKRVKIKAVQALLRFSTPLASELLAGAAALSAAIEAPFLWECLEEGEFSFTACAADYFGHPPSALEATAVLLALHAAPVYFHRKGKGRFRKAPADILAAALAALEKKRQQALAMDDMVATLKAGALPAAFAPLLRDLLYKPDRNRLETKALEAACADTGLSVAHLLARCGGIRSAHDYHLQRFLYEYFPRGEAIEVPDGVDVLCDVPLDLPLAAVQAFSIDDAATTEIDDAFSVQARPDGGWCIGIHIAAPGLGFAPDSPLDVLARQRLSTVYAPGKKITMLPTAVVAQFTLAAGRECPAVSLYLQVSPELEWISCESRVERVPIVANLRLHQLAPWFNAVSVTQDLPSLAFRDELLLLWRFAEACARRRGKPATTPGLHDYSFEVHGDLAEPEACRIEISERQRGSPLDTLVAELMIVANSTWGGLLAERGVAGIYRAQTGGKVRMTTAPQPHEGLGVAQYAWSSSPLRRYVDLLNQWQLIAVLQNQPPPFGGHVPPRNKGNAQSETLFALMRDFELTYAAYAEFQRGMERYWCLRWLQQEGISDITAVVRREKWVKFAGLPLLQQVPSLPELATGQSVRLAIGTMDLLDLALECRYEDTLAAITPSPAFSPEATAVTPVLEAKC